MTSAFDHPTSYPLHDEAASFPQAQNPLELQDITKRDSIGSANELPWAKLPPHGSPTENLLRDTNLLQELQAIRAQDSQKTQGSFGTVQMSSSQLLPPPPSAPVQTRYLSASTESLHRSPKIHSKQTSDLSNDMDDVETSSATSNDSSTSLPVSRDMTGDSSYRRRASSQDALTWEKRIQLENEIAQHVKIAEMQEEVEFHRRKTAYSDKEIQTIKSQLDQALFKKAAAEAELREFDKRIRARDVQLRQQVEQLERKVAQGEAAQNTLEKIQKQFSDLEVRLRNEINLKFSTEGRLREKERQLAEMQSQLQQLVQEKSRLETRANSTGLRTPVKPATRTPSKPTAARTPSSGTKPPVPRARSASLKSDIETQSDTGVYKSPSNRSIAPRKLVGQKQSSLVAPPSPPSALVIENVDITSKDRSLFATRYMNKSGLASPHTEGTDAAEQTIEDSFVVIPGPEETDISVSAD
jgi:myosin heavy subunit